MDSRNIHDPLNSLVFWYNENQKVTRILHYLNFMSNEYDQITLKNGRLLIYRRRDCGDHFHCRMRFRGRKGYVRKSLDTRDKDESIREGEKLFDDLNVKGRVNLYHRGGVKVYHSG